MILNGSPNDIYNKYFEKKIYSKVENFNFEKTLGRENSKKINNKDYSLNNIQINNHKNTVLKESDKILKEKRIKEILKKNLNPILTNPILHMQNSNNNINKNIKRKILHEKRKKIKLKTEWRRLDDIKLIELVEIYHCDWRKISLIMNKTEDVIRQRYLKRLDPKLKFTKFTPEEDYLIISLFKIHGSTWNYISKFLPNRSSIMVKNRFYSSLKKKISSENNLIEKESLNTNDIVNNIYLNYEKNQNLYEFLLKNKQELLNNKYYKINDSKNNISFLNENFDEYSSFPMLSGKISLESFRNNNTSNKIIDIEDYVKSKNIDLSKDINLLNILKIQNDQFPENKNCVNIKQQSKILDNERIKKIKIFKDNNKNEIISPNKSFEFFDDRYNNTISNHYFKKENNDKSSLISFNSEECKNKIGSEKNEYLVKIIENKTEQTLKFNNEYSNSINLNFNNSLNTDIDDYNNSLINLKKQEYIPLHILNNEKKDFNINRKESFNEISVDYNLDNTSNKSSNNNKFDKMDLINENNEKEINGVFKIFSNLNNCNNFMEFDDIDNDYFTKITNHENNYSSSLKRILNENSIKNNQYSKSFRNNGNSDYFSEKGNLI